MLTRFQPYRISYSICLHCGLEVEASWAEHEKESKERKGEANEWRRINKKQQRICQTKKRCSVKDWHKILRKEEYTCVCVAWLFDVFVIPIWYNNFQNCKQKETDSHHPFHLDCILSYLSYLHSKPNHHHTSSLLFSIFFIIVSIQHFNLTFILCFIPRPPFFMSTQNFKVKIGMFH